MTKILLIDDDITALDLIDLLFKKSGFECIRLISGINVVNKINQEKPDLIIIDLMMPDLSGSDTIKEIRANNIDLPIIAFTASNDSDYQDQALVSGANQVITKPYSTNKLLELVNKYLNNLNKIH